VLHWNPRLPGCLPDAGGPAGEKPALHAFAFFAARRTILLREMGRHVTKSIYVPGDPDGKGIVAIALDPGEPKQKRVLDLISTIPSAELRTLLGIEDWKSLERICGDASKSGVLRERLPATVAREPEKHEKVAHGGLRRAPAGHGQGLQGHPACSPTRGARQPRDCPRVVGGFATSVRGQRRPAVASFAMPVS